MPRGIAQTMYTEIADKVAEVSAAENKELHKIENTLITPVSNEEVLPDPETAESALECSESMDEVYPPVATEDHSSKVCKQFLFVILKLSNNYLKPTRLPY